MKHVVDVSEHQGVIDWDTVKGNIDGAIIRLGYGGDYSEQDDKQAVRNISECERLGIPWGAYLYSYAADADSARAEFKHAQRVLNGKLPALGVWLDTEEAGLQSASRSAANAFCAAAKSAGYHTGVYTYQSWYWQCLEGIENEWPVWGASYGDSCTIPNIVAWQYTSDGSVPGVQGRVDLNHWYDESGFNAGAWVQTDNGRWWYRNTDGSWPTGWANIGDTWYLFDGDGWMLTGWQLVEGKWYLLADSGAMLTGWQMVGGKWYYMTNTGAMATGWIKNGDTWYYTDSDGKMQTGWQLVDGTWYFMDETGAMAEGCAKTIGDTFYAFDESGKLMPHAIRLTEVDA